MPHGPEIAFKSIDALDLSQFLMSVVYRGQ